MLSIRNLDAPLGAEVSGVDVSKPLPQADIDTIENAWRERLVVVMHGQSLTDPQLIAFSRNFGELDPPGPNPYGEPFLKEHPSSTSSPTWSRTESRSAISATARRCGTPT